MVDQIYLLTESIVLSCCNLKRYEKLLVISDWSCFEIGRAFHCASEKRCKEAMLVLVSPDKFDDSTAEPGIELLSKFDVIIVTSAAPVAHSAARQTAVQSGCRIIYITSISPEIFLHTMNVDWRLLNARTRRVATRLIATHKIHITTPLGTDISFEIIPETVSAFDGRIGLRGTYGFLPSGFVSAIPVAGSANGTVAVDGTCSIVNNLQTEPLFFHVKNGEIIAFEEHSQSKILHNSFVSSKADMKVLSELSIGTSELNHLWEDCTLDRMTHGTIYFSFGGSKIKKEPARLEQSWFKVLFRNATVFVDGRLWFKDGVID
ncbi:MAG: aminopeptidase [Fibrobacter sp.]|nr:aminopeptidase [Fibrobacter sp.]